MTGEKDGGAAFPKALDPYPNTSGSVGGERAGQPGMSLRQWYAGQALAGFLANGSQRLIAQAIEEGPDRNLIQDASAKAAVVNEQIAIGCFALADAMIAQGSKP